MATNAEKSGGEKRVKRAAKKKPTTVAKKPATVAKKSTAGKAPPIEEVVFRPGETAAPTPIFRRGSVRHVDITNFLRQLIMLLEAGTPILKSLQTLSQRGERAAARQLVGDIAQFVEGGNPLWQSFDRHPRYFDAVFVNLIKASEASGTLVTVLRRVVDYREARELLTKRVRSAMIYPVVLVLACLGVMLLLTNYVVPEFEAMFSRANLDVPDLTKNFLACSKLFQVWWWVPLLAFVGLWLLYRVWFVQNPLRRLAADRVKLKLPVAGTIIHKTALVELSRTMSLLLRSGLSMMATLDLTRNAIHNRAVAATLQSMRDSVEQGGGLEAPMRAASHLIPPVVADMFVTGEESGRVDAIAEQIAETYDEEVKIAVAGLGEALQPIFTIIIGLAVIVLFVALFLPLVSMIDQIAGGGV